MEARITNAASEISPLGPKIRAATEAAVAELTAQDHQNAEDIRGVAASASPGSGTGRFKTAFGVGKDMPPLSPADPTPSPSPTPQPSAGVKPLDPKELLPFGPEGDLIDKTSEQAGKHASGRWSKDSQKLGKGFSWTGNFGQLWLAEREIDQAMNHGQPGGSSFKDAAIDVVPKTLGNIAGSSMGATIGAAHGAVGGASFGGKFGKLLFGSFDEGELGEDVGEVIGGLAGAAAGAVGGGQLGGQLGEGLGKSLSGTLHQWFG